MDSINRNQPEDTLEHLRGAAAIKRIQEMVEKTPVGFFCTYPTTPGSHGVRPMSVLKVDDIGNLWFLSAGDSQHNKDIEANPVVRMYFQGSVNSDFLHLDGRASISQDRKKIEELWKPLLKTWFIEGIEDPRITVICYEPEGGYYWDTKHGNVVAGIKILIGSAIGKTLDDSVEGELSP